MIPQSMLSIDRNSKERRYVPHGPFPWTLKNGGIEYLSGGNNYRRPGNLRSGFYAWDWGKKGVTQRRLVSLSHQGGRVCRARQGGAERRAAGGWNTATAARSRW